MKVRYAFRGIRRAMLDTAPVIYLVEGNPTYLAVMEAIGTLLRSSNIEVITSPVTLAECLVHPCRLADAARRQVFVNTITRGRNTRLHAITGAEGAPAADLRAKYNLELADALQVAVAITSGCDALLTNDRHLARITEVRVLLVSDLET